jgi:hypothetical protein
VLGDYDAVCLTCSRKSLHSTTVHNFVSFYIHSERCNASGMVLRTSVATVTHIPAAAVL